MFAVSSINAFKTQCLIAGIFQENSIAFIILIKEVNGICHVKYYAEQK